MNKEVLIAFFYRFFEYCKSFFIAIFPVRAVATFFGIGYLPEWQDHWSTFFSIVFVLLAIHFCVGVNNDAIVIAVGFLYFSVLLCILSFISIKLYEKNDSNAKYQITIHLVFGQIFTFACSMPGIISFHGYVLSFDTALCKNFIYCSPWFLDVIIYTPTMLFPYFVFQAVTLIKPWPCYVLDNSLIHSVGNTALGFFSAVYATIFIYMFSFIFLDLSLISVIEFYGLFFELIMSHLKS